MEIEATTHEQRMEDYARRSAKALEQVQSALMLLLALVTRLACQRLGSEASLEVVPVFANGPTGLVSITINLPPGDHLTVHVDAAAFADSLRRALGERS